MSRMLPLERVVREFKEHGFIFTDTEYRGVDVNHECICSCGRTTMKSLTNVRSGKKCLGCKSDGFTGPLNPRWNPELTDEEREDKRDTTENIRWRKAVYERDDYTCHHCGDRGSRLNAHHIVPYCKKKELRLDEGNGVTLCTDCHKDVHKGLSLKIMDSDSFKQYSEYNFPEGAEKEKIPISEGLWEYETT